MERLTIKTEDGYERISTRTKKLDNNDFERNVKHVN